MDSKNVIITFILVALCATGLAQQRQLIALKDEDVLARYQKGDIIKFMRAHDKELQIQRILDLNDTLIMMNFDSVNYYQIEKLDIKAKQGSKFSERIGSSLIIAGLVLPLADLFNTTVIQDQEASVSEGVWITSAAMVGTGAALVFIKKPYFKPGRHYHLIIVDERSPFYKARTINNDDTFNFDK
jgi:hypothetical protein